MTRSRQVTLRDDISVCDTLQCHRREIRASLSVTCGNVAQIEALIRTRLPCKMFRNKKYKNSCTDGKNKTDIEIKYYKFKNRDATNI